MEFTALAFSRLRMIVTDKSWIGRKWEPYATLLRTRRTIHMVANVPGFLEYDEIALRMRLELE